MTSDSKRGEPRLFDDDPAMRFGLQSGEPKSYRSEQDFVHVARGIADKAGRRGAVKHRVLAELGRMATALGADTARTFAESVNRAFLAGQIATVPEAADRLRAVRLTLTKQRRRPQQKA